MHNANKVKQLCIAVAITQSPNGSLIVAAVYLLSKSIMRNHIDTVELGKPKKSSPHPSEEI
ncbi:hypothetical protein N480_09645 [Pseudoalteromonas luteoviolacea S2607]|nr:hypothetical protein N480_09645 [Pseudoalteromonas luteoviolacea S2607]